MAAILLTCRSGLKNISGVLRAVGTCASTRDQNREETLRLEETRESRGGTHIRAFFGTHNV